MMQNNNIDEFPVYNEKEIQREFYHSAQNDVHNMEDKSIIDLAIQAGLETQIAEHIREIYPERLIEKRKENLEAYYY